MISFLAAVCAWGALLECHLPSRALLGEVRM
eukprot:SAG25_NODE_12968_length_273_cov_0.591954_1_plen_30_part_10